MHYKKRSKQKNEFKRIALERIEILFYQAAKRDEFAKRYIRLARKLATKYKVKIPTNLKRKYCKQCNSYLNTTNSTIRMRNKRVIISCNECKKITRIPIT